MSSAFQRKSTVIHLHGAGEEGIGEDVTYDGVDHEILQQSGPGLELAGRFTLATFAEHLAAQYPGVIRRGVEGAPFAVLHRTAMPSVLVETAFISNPQEEARLRTPRYQRVLAQGILQGLRQFLQTAIVALH